MAGTQSEGNSNKMFDKVHNYPRVERSVSLLAELDPAGYACSSAHIVINSTANSNHFTIKVRGIHSQQAAWLTVLCASQHSYQGRRQTIVSD